MRYNFQPHTPTLSDTMQCHRRTDRQTTVSCQRPRTAVRSAKHTAFVHVADQPTMATLPAVTSTSQRSARLSAHSKNNKD